MTEQTGAFEPIPSPSEGKADPVCRKARLVSVLGLQTDYSESGRGVLSPTMIAAVLQDARRG